MADSLGSPVQGRGPFRFGAVVLAAGGSSRMGTPKQLLPIAGTPLLVRTVRALLESSAWPIVVVLGNAADQLRPLLTRWPLQVVENPGWQEGMGSSLSAGIEILDRFSSSLQGALIALGDQPCLSPAAIQALSSAFGGSAGIVAARYSETLGAPAIFGRSFFPELLALPPAAGAQRLLRAHAEKVVPVDLPELAVDLDTPEDYRRFLDNLGPR